MVSAVVYKLISGDYYYIGSSYSFKARLKNHKKQVIVGKNGFHEKARENGGWETVNVVILREWDTTVDDMQAFEGTTIDECIADPFCMNQKTAGKTKRSSIGKVYKLRIKDHYFYGKTRDVYHRMASHKTQTKSGKSKLYEYIRGNGGWNEVNHEIVWEQECTEKELKDAEDSFIRSHLDDPNCLNSMPGSTTSERMRELNNARVKKWVERDPERARLAANKRAAKHRAKKKAEQSVVGVINTGS